MSFATLKGLRCFAVINANATPFRVAKSFLVGFIPRVAATLGWN